MKKVLMLAVLLALATPLFGEEKLPKDLQKCPFGHCDLVFVPIDYGLFEAKGAKKEKGIGKLPPTFGGGCLVYPDSPKNVIGCPTCGFYYWPPSNRNNHKGTWTLRVANQAELFKPLSPTLSDFPGVEGKSKKAKISYVQTLDRHDRLTSESIRIERKGKLADAEALLKPWLISKGIDPQTADRSEEFISWRKNRLAISVFQDGRMLNISVTHRFTD